MPGSAGFLQQTDAFEVLSGSVSNTPSRIGSQVQGVAGVGSIITVNISPDPFNPAEVIAAGTADGPIVMFWTPGRHCIGRVTSYTSLSPNVATVTVSTLDQDLANATTAWTPGCPLPAQRAEVMAVRRRYLVYQNAVSPGSHRSLASTSRPTTVTRSTTTLARRALPRWASRGWCRAASTTCRLSGTCRQGWLTAEHGTAGARHRFPCPAVGSTSPAVSNTPLAASIYGAQIFLASEGSEPYTRGGEGKPQLGNRPAVNGDNIVRTVMQTSVEFRNEVTP